jgi:hypothetical protein
MMDQQALTDEDRSRRSMHRTWSLPGYGPIRRGCDDREPPCPGHERLLRLAFAISIVGRPLMYILGGLLAPSIHDTGQATIAANAAANEITNDVHLAAFVLESFLFPIGAVGMAALAYRRAPWLATVGGLLAVIGWVPVFGVDRP